MWCQGSSLCDWQPTLHQRWRPVFVSPLFCSTNGLQAVPHAADHNLTWLYQLSVNFRHTEHCRITAAVVTLFRPRDNAGNQNTSKFCKVNFPAEYFKTALFTRATITNKTFPRTTRQLFLVHAEGDPGTVLCREGGCRYYFVWWRVVAGTILCVRGGASGNLLEFACTDWWKSWNPRIQSVLVESPGPQGWVMRHL